MQIIGSRVSRHPVSEVSDAPHETEPWGSDSNVDAVESKQVVFPLSLFHSPECSEIYVPVTKHAVLFLSGWTIFCSPARLILRIMALVWLTLSRFWPLVAHTELTDVLSFAVEKLNLDWPEQVQRGEPSKLNERFLSGHHSHTQLPFFHDLHEEIANSSKQPFSALITNAPASDFTNAVGSVEQGYACMPVVEEMLAVHLSLPSAFSRKAQTILPTKPCRTTSVLIGKFYTVVYTVV